MKIYTLQSSDISKVTSEIEYRLSTFLLNKHIDQIKLYTQMEEILALQRKLAEVQETTNAQRLSDRNVVEIIEAIVKNFDIKLLYTSDGKEYLTPEHLDREIKELVLARGRINVIELPKLLNVGIEKIDARLDQLCRKSGALILINGNLFTNQYLDSICEEINEELQHRHRMSISELTIKYNFSYDYLLGVITSRVGTIIQGEVKNKQILTTLAYANTIRAQIRGVLRACIRPIAISQIRKNYEFEDSIISEIIDDLIAKKELDGKLISGSYVSNKFVQDQENIVRNFFKQNTYLEYDFLQKNLFISKPEDFLKSLFKSNEGIFLETCFYSQEALENLKQHIVELLQSDGYVELETVVPSAFNESDIENILNKYMELKNVTLKGNIIISNEFLDKWANKFRDRITDILMGRPVKFITAGPAPEEEKKGKSGKGKKGGKAKEPAERDPFDQQEVIAILRQSKLFPEDYNPELEEAIYPVLKEKISDLSKKLKVELFENKKTPLSNEVGTMQAKVEERILQMQLMLKSVKKFAEKGPAGKYLLDKAIQYSRPIIDQFILLFCRKYAIQLPDTLYSEQYLEKKGEDDSTEPKIITLDTPPVFKNPDLLILAIDTLPKDLAKLLRNINKLLDEKNLDEFYDELQSKAHGLGIKPLSLDKKTEKNILYSQKYFLREQIAKGDMEPKEAFFNVLQCLLLEQNLFFGLTYNNDVQLVEDLATMILDNLTASESDREQAKIDLIKQGLELYKDSKNEELEKKNQEILSKIN